MNVSVHLISMPWSEPSIPSIQLGALKAYLDRAFSGSCQTRSYSAFLSIPYRQRGSLCFEAFRELSSAGEYAYFALYCRRYLKDGLAAPRSFNAFCRAAGLSVGLVNSLEQATLDFANEELLPNLGRGEEAINLIGFSLNYDQSFSSAYMARLIEELVPEARPVFAFGGYGSGNESTMQIFKQIGVRGYGLIGEGEAKLEELVRQLASGKKPNVPGVFDLQSPPDLMVRSEETYRSQFSDLNSLPLPDYDEFFERGKAYGNIDPIFKARFKPEILLEGTRGCFAKCDFCGLNSQWRGFRKQTAAHLVSSTRAACDRYGLRTVRFADSVCDTWAEAFADAMKDSPLDGVFLELRAHHPEAFWVKLAQAGVNKVQIGVEAFAAGLLRRIGKGTFAFQNIATQKFLKELGIWSISNLITHHPKSTLADIEETRHVLEATTHLEELLLARFWVAPFSPIHQQLTDEQRKRLVPVEKFEFPVGLKRLEALRIQRGCDLPPELGLAAETSQAWDDFTVWYRKTYLKWVRSGGTLLIERKAAGGALVRDTRYSKKAVETLLEGETLRLYDRCHGGAAGETLCRELGLTVSRLEAITTPLLERKLLLLAGDHYVALALRPRQELIDRSSRGSIKSTNEQSIVNE